MMGDDRAHRICIAKLRISAGSKSGKLSRKKNKLFHSGAFAHILRVAQRRAGSNALRLGARGITAHCARTKCGNMRRERTRSETLAK